MTALPGSAVLAVRRGRRVRTASLDAVVVDVDPTTDERALAVLQAPLVPRDDGGRIVYGYDVAPAGLGAWVGDRRLRIRLWPAVVDAAGEVVEDDHEAPGADVLALDVDPAGQRDLLDGLIDCGRLVVAAPDAGPVPLVVDLDPELVRAVLAEVDATA